MVIVAVLAVLLSCGRGVRCFRRLQRRRERVRHAAALPSHVPCNAPIVKTHAAAQCARIVRRRGSGPRLPVVSRALRPCHAHPGRRPMPGFRAVTVSAQSRRSRAHVGTCGAVLGRRERDQDDRNAGVALPPAAILKSGHRRVHQAASQSWPFQWKRSRARFPAQSADVVADEFAIAIPRQAMHPPDNAPEEISVRDLPPHSRRTGADKAVRFRRSITSRGAVSLPAHRRNTHKHGTLAAASTAHKARLCDAGTRGTRHRCA